MSTNGPPARRSYREGAAFSGMSFALMALLGIGSGIVIARAYGIQALGGYALATAPVTVVWYLSSTRERPAFVRELAMLEPRAPRVTGLFGAMLTFSFVLTLLVGGLGILGTWFVFHGPIDHPELFLPTAANVLGYIFVTNTGWNIESVFSGFLAGRELFWIRLHQTVSFLVLAIVGSFVFDDVWGLVLANIGASLTSTVHRVISIRPYMRFRVSREELRRGFETLPGIIKFGLKILPGSLANGVSNEAGTWMLGAVASIATVGAYDRAWQLSRRFIELNFRVTEMLFPTLVARHESGDGEGFDRALVDTIRYCAIGMLLPAATAGGAAYGVMALFGGGFTQAADGLTLLILAPVLITIAAIQRNALFALDKPWLSSVVVLFRMVVTVVLIAVLTPPYGINGAATAILAGTAASSIWMSIVTRRVLKRPLKHLWPPREIAALLLAYAAGFLAARVVQDAIGGIPGVVPAMSAGTIAYLSVFWVTGGLNDRDRARLAAGVKALKARRERSRAPKAAAAGRP